MASVERATDPVCSWASEDPDDVDNQGPWALVSSATPGEARRESRKRPGDNDTEDGGDQERDLSKNGHTKAVPRNNPTQRLQVLKRRQGLKWTFQNFDEMNRFRSGKFDALEEHLRILMTEEWQKQWIKGAVSDISQCYHALKSNMIVKSLSRDAEPYEALARPLKCQRLAERTVKDFGMIVIGFKEWAHAQGGSPECVAYVCGFLSVSEQQSEGDMKEVLYDVLKQLDVLRKIKLQAPTKFIFYENNPHLRTFLKEDLQSRRLEASEEEHVRDDWGEHHSAERPWCIVEGSTLMVLAAQLLQEHLAGLLPSSSSSTS